MEHLLLFIIGISFLIIFVLLTKIYFLRRSAREIAEAFRDRLAENTNTLIDISSRDRYMRSLANSVNTELRTLRDKRRRYEQGDMELKAAVTNISHDLRTPLTAICGYLDLLEAEEDARKAEGYIRVIRNRAELMTQLTEELFRYSIIVSDEKSATRETVNVGGVLEECVASFYTDLKARNIEPNIQIPEKKVVRTLDRSALVRVFSNLLNNAIKYSDGDLDITLTENGAVIFTNTASKLNEVQVGRLFDRFYTVEPARKSTGLGLTIARTLIERMHGTISAQYKSPRLTITVELPDDK